MSPSDNYFTRGRNSMVAPFVGPPSNNNVNIPIAPTIAGTFSFAATLSLSTFLQSKLFHVSTGTAKPIPSFLGLGSVAIASLVCHFVSIQTFQMTHQLDFWDVWKQHGYGCYSYNRDSSFFVNYSSFKLPASMLSLRESSHNSYNKDQYFGPFRNYDYSKNNHSIFNDTSLDVAHSLRVVLVGLIAYKGLGGRFWSVSPSSYTHLGSFARRINSLPASSAYATLSERQMIGRLGRVLGCHTCGDRMIMKKGLRSGTKFIADHIPPKAAVKQMESRWHRRLFNIKVKQRFYPQCVNCSKRQSNILSDASRIVHKLQDNYSNVFFRRIPNLAQAGGGSKAYVHGLKLRREHFAGGLLAAATVGGVEESNELDILNGNKIRFREWQLKVENVLENCWSYIRWNL